MNEFHFSFVDLLLSGLRLSTPLLFAALGGLLSERAGVANIALEGFLLVGAFSAAAVTYLSGNPWIGLSGALAAGAMIGLIFAMLTVYAKADHIVMGTALNLFVVGALPLFNKIFFGVTGSTPSLELDQRLSVWFLFFVAVALSPLIWFFLHKVPFGYHLRSSGENIEASKSLGISVKRTRLIAVILAGMVTALGGAFLSIAHGSQFSRGMSAGRGFIALAALILAGWRPIPVILTCILFGLADAAQIVLQSYPLPDGSTLPVQWIQMFPYIVTLVVLVGFVGKTEPPQAIAKND
ncbi:MAG: ABC transporter permease [Deltaproteobacteria bacterium]|nr:ABC transporter permease [Deltaproteobacteria bacterium]